MHRLLMSIPILVFVVMLAAGKVWAQDPVKVAPKNFKVVLENEQFRFEQGETFVNENLSELESWVANAERTVQAQAHAPTASRPEAAPA